MVGLIILVMTIYDSGDDFSDDSSFDFPVVSLSQLDARRL